MTPPDADAQASTGASEVLLGFGAPVPGDTPARHEVGGGADKAYMAFGDRKHRLRTLDAATHCAEAGAHQKAERYLSGFGRPAACDTPTKGVTR